MAFKTIQGRPYFKNKKLGFLFVRFVFKGGELRAGLWLSGELFPSLYQGPESNLQMTHTGEEKGKRVRSQAVVAHAFTSST